MAQLSYRTPGYPSKRSQAYLRALRDVGWPEKTVQELEADIPRFESASIQGAYEDAVKVFAVPPDEAHKPFLEGLNEYIKALTQAERNEELHRKASTQDKDSIDANKLLSETTDADLSDFLGNPIKFDVQEPKAEFVVTYGQKRDNSTDS